MNVGVDEEGKSKWKERGIDKGKQKSEKNGD